MLSLLLIAIVTFTPFVWSQETIYASDLDKQWKSSAQLKVSDYEYSEPGLMSFTGSLSGVELQTSYKIDPIFNAIYFELSYLSGDTIYNGQTLDGSQKIVSSAHDNLTFSRLLYTRNVVTNRNRPQIDISTGLGYRYLYNDNLSRDREQTTVFLPVELGWKVPNLTHSLSMRLSLTWNMVVSAKTVSHWEQIDPILAPITYEQKSGNGYQIAAYLDHSLESIKLAYSLGLRAWSFKDSTVETLQTVSGREVVNSKNRSYRFVEPSNRTTLFTLGLGVVF